MENVNMTLKDSRIVVLGGTSGIGLAVARAAISEGAEVVVGSSSTTRVSEAVAALGGNANGHAVDISDEAATRAFFQRVGGYCRTKCTGSRVEDLLGRKLDIWVPPAFFFPL
jgi:NAD(P)-dependent dehydrogenase (short-subunit alcohol dehydrogenase family)